MKTKLIAGVNAYRTAKGKLQPAQAVFGDIIVNDNWVYMPTGSWPLAGTRWQTEDIVTYCENVYWPRWAVVMLILTIWTVVLWAFFLIPRKRETVIQGHVQVNVYAADGRYATAQIPVKSAQAVAEINQRAAWVNNLAISLS